jgi:hypothetical protein
MTMPTGINAGSYPLHYMIKGDANHNDIGVIILNCDIDKADPTLVPPIGLNLIYNTSEQLLLSEGESSEGTQFRIPHGDSEQPAGTGTGISAVRSYPAFRQVLSAVMEKGQTGGEDWSGGGDRRRGQQCF